MKPHYVQQFQAIIASILIYLVIQAALIVFILIPNIKWFQALPEHKTITTPCWFPKNPIFVGSVSNIVNNGTMVGNITAIATIQIDVLPDTFSNFSKKAQLNFVYWYIHEQRINDKSGEYKGIYEGAVIHYYAKNDDSTHVYHFGSFIPIRKVRGKQHSSYRIAETLAYPETQQIKSLIEKNRFSQFTIGFVIFDSIATAICCLVFCVAYREMKWEKHQEELRGIKTQKTS